MKQAHKPTPFGYNNLGKSAGKGMFSPEGLAVFLTAHEHYAFVDEPPKIDVDLFRYTDAYTTAEVTAQDLTCSECDEPLDPPPRQPAKWVAMNKLLRGGTCLSCTGASEQAQD